MGHDLLPGILIGIATRLLAGWLWRRVRDRLPALVIDGHRLAERLRWRRKSRPRGGGRPTLAGTLIERIRRMSLSDALWGAPRLHGELQMLGIKVAQSTVSKYMVPRRGRPTQAWKTFVDNHLDEIAAVDLLSVTSAAFRRLYAFVILGLGRRVILHVEVTDHPTAPWLAGQITEAFPWDEAPRFIIRDNDGAYGLAFRGRLKAMGIQDRPITPYCPWQNGYVERVIGTIKRECLSHYIFRDEAHLRRVLRGYVDYYNNDRTHLALDKDAPNVRLAETEGEIVSMPVLGGLHHRYSRTPPNSET